jgi:polar amino acid transport system substrate-binding protein
MPKKEITRLTAALILAFSVASVDSKPLQAFDPDKTYLVGIEAAFAPWSYVEQGELKGVAVEAFRAVAESEGIKIDLKDYPWPSLIPALRAGKIDVLAGAVSIKKKRDEVVDFCIPNNTAWDEVVVAKDSTLTLGEALFRPGAKVGVQAGAFQDDWATANLVGKGFDVQLVRSDDIITLVSELGTGRVDAVIIAKTPTAKLLEKKRPIKILARLWETRRSHASCTVQQGDPNNLLATLNRGFVKLGESGKWCEIWRKYMPSTLECGSIPGFMPDWVETFHPAPGLGQ